MASPASTSGGSTTVTSGVAGASLDTSGSRTTTTTTASMAASSGSGSGELLPFSMLASMISKAVTEGIVAATAGAATARSVPGPSSVAGEYCML